MHLSARYVTARLDFFFHIPWTCTCNDEGRNELFDDHDKSVLPHPATTSWFWTRGLMSRTLFPGLPPRDDSCTWHSMHGDCQMITEHVFSDGAYHKYHYWPEASRAGWGPSYIVMCTNRGPSYIVMCLWGLAWPHSDFSEGRAPRGGADLE
eukprot:3349526-Pyramimonas_sp.AAC.1